MMKLLTERAQASDNCLLCCFVPIASVWPSISRSSWVLFFNRPITCSRAGVASGRSVALSKSKFMCSTAQASPVERGHKLVLGHEARAAAE